MSRKSSLETDERDKTVLDWLLEPDPPAIRYHALVNLLGCRVEDPELGDLSTPNEFVF